MQYDDIAFQRAILANPADTTLKLVYADWLQDRADPRAEYVRAQIELAGAEEALNRPLSYTFPTSPLQAQLEREDEAKKVAEARRKLIGSGRTLHPEWVGFMQSLAQPFAAITFQEGTPGHPFTETVGRCGRVAMLESKYRAADIGDGGLLADLAFLISIEWGECCYGATDCPMYGFLCEESIDHGPLTARGVLTAIKAADFQSEHIAMLDASEIPYQGYHPYTINDEIHTDFRGQKMFERKKRGAGNAGNHGLLRRYVVGKRVWYALLHIGSRPCDMVTLLAVGRSPHGNRLVGAITSQMCHNLCD
jgi:uncharacterized protein (TIGR02996 family)